MGQSKIFQLEAKKKKGHMKMQGLKYVYSLM